MDVLVSGKASFKLEVPYRLINSGEDVPKPLIIYLHGYNQNMEYFQNTLTEVCSKFNAYHLFLQAPYPARLTKKKEDDWGYAWYMYDGKQGSFEKNLEYTSQYIQEVVDNIISLVNVNRLCIIGYSMGGYQAAHFALSRWKHVNEMIVAGCRIKTEFFSDRLSNLTQQNILAIHGLNDEKVSAERQRKEIELLVKNGINAEFKGIKEKHQFSAAYINEIVSYLVRMKYPVNAV